MTDEPRELEVPRADITGKELVPVDRAFENAYLLDAIKNCLTLAMEGWVQSEENKLASKGLPPTWMAGYVHRRLRRDPDIIAAHPFPTHMYVDHQRAEEAWDRPADLTETTRIR